MLHAQRPALASAQCTQSSTVLWDIIVWDVVTDPEVVMTVFKIVQTFFQHALF